MNGAGSIPRFTTFSGSRALTINRVGALQALGNTGSPLGVLPLQPGRVPIQYGVSQILLPGHSFAGVGSCPLFGTADIEGGVGSHSAPCSVEAATRHTEDN